MGSRLKGSQKDLVISSVAVSNFIWGENSHFVVRSSVKNKQSNFIPSLALIDSGASAHGFIDSNFAQKQNLDLIELSKPRTLKVFDGSNSSAGQITHIAKPF